MSGDPISDGMYLHISGGDGANNQYSTDEIDPIAPAVTVFTYDSSATTPEQPPTEPVDLKTDSLKQETEGILSSGTGAIRVEDTYKIVFFSFGFEGINNSDENNREIVMERVIKWLREGFDVWDIEGNIKYYANDDSVDEAIVHANSTYKDTTDASGFYELIDLSPGNYVVRPEKENDTGNAISALDAVWILQNGVGMRTFTPYQMIAGDVTGNGAISAYDAAKVLQYGVGLINKFPVMPDTTHFWRFVPEDYIVTQTNWNIAPDSIVYIPLKSDTTDDYLGIIYGYVTGNWHPSGADLTLLGKSSASADIRLENIYGEVGEKVILPILIENGSDIVAMSFSLEYDHNILKALIASTTEITENWQIAYNVKQGLIKVALAGSQPIEGSGSVVNLEFEVLETESPDAGSVLEITEMVINDGSIAANIQAARFETGSPVPNEYALHQNYPNPFNPETMIKYQLPKSGKVVLKIYNTLGQEIRTLIDKKMEAGYCEIH